MTDRLAEILNTRKIGKKKLFLPYLTFGYPNIPKFLDLLKICQDQGVDAIEIGIPILIQLLTVRYFKNLHIMP